MQLALDIGLKALEMLEIELVKDRPSLPKADGRKTVRQESTGRLELKINPSQTFVARSTSADAVSGKKPMLSSSSGEKDDEKQKTPRGKKKSKEIAMKEMNDEAMLAAMRILMNLCAPTYVLRPDLNMRVAFTMVDLTQKHGVSAIGAFGYGLYALICFLFDLNEAHRAGRIGMQLLEKFKAVHLTAKLYGLFYAHVDVWKNPIKSTLAPLQYSVLSGKYFLFYGCIT